MANKKNRTKNFDEGEKELLLELIEDYKYIVENKNTLASTNNDKAKAWDKITTKFNLINNFTRTLEQLKNCYENIKKRAKLKNHLADDNTEKVSTRNGTMKVNDIEYKVIHMLKPNDIIYNDDTEFTKKTVPIPVEKEQKVYTNQEKHNKTEIASFLVGNTVDINAISTVNPDNTDTMQIHLLEENLVTNRTISFIPKRNGFKKARVRPRACSLKQEYMKLKISLLQEEHEKKMELYNLEKALKQKEIELKTLKISKFENIFRN